MFFQTQTARRPPILTLTFKLVRARDPSTSSVWVWRKSVQRFPRYFIHTQTKKSQTALKTEPYTQFTACGKNAGKKRAARKRFAARHRTMSVVGPSRVKFRPFTSCVQYSMSTRRGGRRSSIRGFRR